MKVLEAAPPPREDRPATRILHDEPAVRVVAFTLRAGQVVAPHQSPSTVLVQVVRGRGTFSGAEGERELREGEAAVYAPGEPHGIAAGGEELCFHAVITPRPG